ncbi:MAG: hypothetical protein GX823_03315, partial [Clostridiales bacterium]|nr:hypothetical protein [Clostridiales bacterium]
MRITNSMLLNTFMNNYNTNLAKLSKLQNQMVTGKKFAHISDDPVSLIYSRQAKYKLSRLNDYVRNVNMANNWLAEAEIGVLEMNGLLKDAYEACIDASTDIKNGGDFTNTAQYIGQLRDHVLAALNTSLGDKYIFAGYNTTGYTDSGENISPFTYTSAAVPVLDSNGDPVFNADGDQIFEEERRLCYNGVDLTSDNPATLDLIGELRRDVMTFDIAIGTAMPVTVNGIDFAFYGTGDTGANLNIYNLLSDMYN